MRVCQTCRDADPEAIRSRAAMAAIDADAKRTAKKKVAKAATERRAARAAMRAARATNPWTCPTHGSDALVELTSNDGREYRACRACEEFEGPSVPMPVTGFYSPLERRRVEKAAADRFEKFFDEWADGLDARFEARSAKWVADGRPELAGVAMIRVEREAAARAVSPPPPAAKQSSLGLFVGCAVYIAVVWLVIFSPVAGPFWGVIERLAGIFHSFVCGVPMWDWKNQC